MIHNHKTLKETTECWINAREAMKDAECDFEDLFVYEEVPGGPILPGRDFTSVDCDLADWEGTSLEFHDYLGDPPTAEELERIWALGFTVVRIDYKDPDLWTSEHKFHGDWSCVKNQKPKVGKPMTVGVERCPAHFISKTGHGQCVRLFGHTGSHEHELLL